MFTGLIESVGKLLRVERGSSRWRFRIGADFGGESYVMGESISVRGVCLTVVDFGEGWFEAEASVETLTRSSLGGIRIGDGLNLERALCVNGRLGGHFVMGHVDGVGKVRRVRLLGEVREIEVVLSVDLLRYVVSKGSVSMDGVSLTVNELGADYFKVMVIPHTRGEVDGGFFKEGHLVNIEVDILGKYVERFMGFGVGELERGVDHKGGISLGSLIEHGFCK